MYLIASSFVGGCSRLRRTENDEGDTSRPGGRDSRSGGRSIQQLQQVVSCELDLLVPPLRCPVLTGDQPRAMQAAEVSVDERVPRLRLVGGALGKAEVPFGVLAPGV